MPKSKLSIATFNVNSINLRLADLLEWIEASKVDVVGIQETKSVDERFPKDEIEKAGLHVIFYGQKSYNGVCIISREPIEDELKHLPGDDDDDQARFIAGTVRGVRILNCYVPQGSEVGSDKFAYKLAWYERLADYIKSEVDLSKPVALVGDFNVAPEDEDIYAPDFFEDEVGAHPDERAALQKVVDLGFTDTFRHFHPDQRKPFTFFDYRTRDSVKFKKGWRIDHIYSTPALLKCATDCEVDMEPRLKEKASDHTPLIAHYEV